MFGHPVFYFSLIRKHVILVGTLFNDIYITRTDPTADNEVTTLIKVPVQFGPKEKALARLDSDPDANRQTAVLTLPRISFEMTNMYYDASRHLNKTGFVAFKDTSLPSKFTHQFNPVPYNFNFVVSIMVKNAADGAKIVEQILPFFTPEWFTSVELIPETGISYDIPIILDSVMPEDLYDGQFDQRRVLIWNLNLVVKGFLFGPITKKPYIKFSNAVFYVPNANSSANAVGNTDPAGTISVSPGLLSNGSPTTNVAATIDRNLINIDDDFGFIVENSGIVILEE